MPEELPLVQGRIHFVRRVDAQGQIEILKERFRLSNRLRGEYVWATIDLKPHTLSVYHRRSAKAKAKRVKQYAYQIEERVEKWPPQFRRRRNRVSVLKII
ncbi:MAG: hypothetical protein HY314_07815 [Acidobacteria bacterium]|nr:hypothetical protein [Acidobacteriota bacterium]